ncbi:Type I phosphodiesterase / nucleotide pyrophosphatase [Desulfitobacterium hafniense]|uniref:Type I phosphodiesterase / nucleotide pyrophosphatase n=1 Tax=Desulfitobacterium hafniense TaxID=49338 RepID=A0A098AX09_DESHA|nr:alkaline phosphatase family protein [Desulfitobacterium hafniense]CDX00657.1 Type I phosphodiesterase / nucleotide pyrophosphatase [Desulfitobacterium hafniense]
MKRKALTEKIAVIGVDGFEPRLAKKFLDQGKMPNLQKFIDRGSCRDDLVLLGAVPTVTPTLWTTLSTGAYPGTHGITCFFGHNHGQLDSLVYNLDSRRCKAEPLWNIYAEEAGKKTLVWHWPGSSWPATSDSPNLHVVDGTQPQTINTGIAGIDISKIVVASDKFEELQFLPNTSTITPGAGCIIENVEELMEDDGEVSYLRAAISSGAKVIKNIITCEEENEVNVLAKMIADSVKSPIKEAAGWTNAPAGAKEFTVILGKGLERRPALLLQNEQGAYDTVQVYKAKKDAEPLVTLKAEQSAYDVVDTITNDDGEPVSGNRNYHALTISPDGSQVTMLIGMAMDVSRDDLFHPKSLYKEVIENIGYVPNRPVVNGANEILVDKVFIPTWDHYSQWQADCLTYFMKNNKYDIIFSHLHNVDNGGHLFWHFAKHQEMWKNNEEAYKVFIERMYIQTDNYIGRFLPYLDEGWTIIVTADHGLSCQEHHGVELGEAGGITTPVMEELGYVTMLKDENGNRTHEFDWAKTKAVASRGNHIYLNLIGRDEHGIVDTKDQYDLETQIISDLYQYRDHKTGKRVVALAMRNKDAVILGLSGPECGDIVYFKEETFNVIHADSLSTQNGYAETSLSPIFVAAGPGIKEGFKTERVIRQVDIAPTMAFLSGVRLPAQSEGSPVHQILTEEI